MTNEGTRRRQRLAVRALAVAAVTAASLGGTAFAAAAATARAEDGKVTICHRTKSKKNPLVTIAVAEKALAAHLAHGDTAAACQTAKAKGKGRGEAKREAGTAAGRHPSGR